MQICLLGNEVFPADRGGIARLLHNMARQIVTESSDARVHILLPSSHAPRLEGLNASFPEAVRLWACPPATETVERLGAGADAKVQGVGRHAELYLDAAAYLFGALDIEAAIGAALTHIEIPEHLGYGNLVLTARAAGIAFQDATIGCRIHSSFTQLLGHEPDYYIKDSWRGARIGMEAECLALADTVIAPLEAIATTVRQAHDLPASATVKINFPAVLDATPEVAPLAPGSEPDFVFASRFQPFKRPELFIRAAVRFLDRNPGYTGTCRLIAYAFDPMYLASLRMMVPQRHAARICFEIDLSEDARAERLANAIVVQSSVYESLCLLAYETAAQQRPVLLAEDCSAFSRNPRWKAGVNCLFFAADEDSLATQMAQALHWRPSEPVDWSADPSWMLTDTARPREEQASAKGAVVIGPVADPASLSAINTLNARLPAGWTLHVYSIGADFLDSFDSETITCHIGDACELQDRLVQRILAQLDCDLVCLASPHALPRPDLLRAASTMPAGIALSALSGSADTLNIFAGTAPSLALQDSRLAPDCICLPRREAIRLLAQSRPTRRLVAALILALQADDLRLVIAPQCWVDQPVSPFEQPDDLRLLGTALDRHGAALIRAGRLSGHDGPALGTAPLLAETPIELQVNGDAAIARLYRDRVEVTAPPGESVFTLALGEPLLGHMLRLTVVPDSTQQAAPLQLHLDLHDAQTEHVERQKHVLALQRHQLILAGPCYGLATLQFHIVNSSSDTARFSLRRLRRLSPA